MIQAFIYLGIGALLHLIFIGSNFDFSSAATWIVLLCGPLIVPILLIFLALTAAIIIAIAEAIGR